MENSSGSNDGANRRDLNDKAIKILKSMECICIFLAYASLVALLVDIIITAIGLLSTLGGVLSIVIPIFALMFFGWLALKFHKDANILWVKNQPPGSSISVKIPNGKQKPPQHLLYNNDSLDREDNCSPELSKF